MCRYNMTTNISLENIYIEEHIDPWAELLNEKSFSPEKLMSSTNSIPSVISPVTTSPNSSAKLSSSFSHKFFPSGRKNTCENRDSRDFHDNTYNKVITINEIINFEPVDIKINKNLEYQYVISKHLKNILRNADGMDESYKCEIIKKMNWIIKSCRYLSSIYNTRKNKQNETKNCVIFRSSYKFCKYNYKCKYFFNKNVINDTCFDHHIVFENVIYDTTSLINYIQQNNNYDNNEIQKCINTICYVINHMKDEFENLKNIGFDVDKC